MVAKGYAAKLVTGASQNFVHAPVQNFPAGGAVASGRFDPYQPQDASPMRRAFSFLSFLLVACLCLLPQIATGEPLTVPVDHITSFVGHSDTGAGIVLAMPGVAVPKGTFAKMKAAIKQRLGLGDDKDAEVDALLAAEFEEAEPTTAPLPSPPQPPSSLGAEALTQAVQAALAPIQQQVQGLTEALSAEKQARQSAQQALEAQQARERDAAVTKTLDEAVKAGKIAPAKRDDWKARLEKDFDGVNAILAELPVNPALAKTQQAAGPAKGAGKEDAAAPIAKAESGTMLGGLRGDVLSYLQADA